VGDALGEAEHTPSDETPGMLHTVEQPARANSAAIERTTANRFIKTSP